MRRAPPRILRSNAASGALVGAAILIMSLMGPVALGEGPDCKKAKSICAEEGTCRNEQEIRLICLSNTEIESYLTDFEARTFVDSRRIFKLPGPKTLILFAGAAHLSGYEHRSYLSQMLWGASQIATTRNPKYFDVADPATSRLSINIDDQIDDWQVEQLKSASEFELIHYAERLVSGMGRTCAIASFGKGGFIRETFALIKELEADPAGIWPVSGTEETFCFKASLYQHWGQLNILAADDSTFEIEGEPILRERARWEALFHLYATKVPPGTPATQALDIVEDFIRLREEG